MSRNDTDRTLALAGLFQAVDLVNQVARRGVVDQDAFQTSIESILRLDADSVAEIYGGVERLRPGLRTLIRQLGGQGAGPDMLVTRYAVSILHLERKLVKRADMMKTIQEGIQRAQHQASHFSVTHANVLANLADLYSETVSQIPPRILIQGEQGYLQNPEYANKVRALLLAAIRSAVLWRHCGGGRLQLLFRRRRFVEEAQSLLDAQTARSAS